MPIQGLLSSLKSISDLIRSRKLPPMQAPPYIGKHCSLLGREQATLDECCRVLCDTVHRGLRVSTRRQGDHAGVAHAEVRSSIYAQQWVDNTTHVSREHRAGSREVVRPDGPFLDVSRSRHISILRVIDPAWKKIGSIYDSGWRMKREQRGGWGWVSCKCKTYFLANSRSLRAPASGAPIALFPFGFNHFARGSVAASPCSINWTCRAITSRSSG